MTRQGLELPEAKRPKSAPNVCRAPRHDQAHCAKSEGGKVGVLKCIDGLLHGATLGTWGNTVNLPMLLIASTRDNLDSSAEMKVGE